MATVRIQLRRGEYQDWYDANPQLAAGELAIETDTNRIKIGDGSTNWRNLDYAIVNNDGTPLTTDDYGQPDGVPQLDASGYIKAQNLPPLAKITVHSVADQAARLALTVEPGDIAIQSDNGTSYVLQSTPASTNANWKELTATQAINDAVNAAVTAMLDGAPGALNTLNELAAAIGDDPTFFTTVATNLSNHENDSTNVHGIANTADLATKAYADQAETDAKAYTDARETAITTAYEAYADQAEGDAKAYTDARETAITTAYEAYADQAEVDAKAYTDARESAITTAYEAYVAGRETAITNAYEAYADQAEVDAKAYADQKVADLVDSSPAALNTLNELAAALGDDPSFATTVSNSIGTKVSKAGDTMTGALTLSGDPVGALHATNKAYVDNLIEGYGNTASSNLTGHNNTIYNVHGIADTSLLATKNYADNVGTVAATELSNHSADTTSVHGISNTADLATKSYADNAASAAQSAAETTAGTALTSHADDTTSIHGITNTANLVYTDDARLSDTRTPTDNTVSTAKIVDLAVTTGKINDLSVTSDKLAVGSVSTAKIVDTSVTVDKLAADSVTTVKITDLNVTTAKIANDAVTSDKIADSAVAAAQLASSAVETAKINDLAVTTEKINDGAITSAKIANGTIVNNDIDASAEIAQSKIANLISDLGSKAPSAGPTFTGTVTLPGTTAIGNVSSTEIGYLDGVTSGIQAQIDTKLASATAASTYAPIASPTFTGTVVLPSTTSVGNVSSTELGYLDGVTSAIQSQLDSKLASSTASSTYAPIASPTFTGTVSGISKSMVGLGNVDNTSDANKPVSTATQTALNAKLSLAGGTMTGALTLSGAPTQDAHAATKAYVDNVSAGINFHQPVRVATTGNITLSGTQTIDGVSLSVGDRVLVKDQTTQTQNGVYVVASGAWTRATDADNTPNGELAGGDFTLVLEGTVNSGYGYVCSNTSAITIGTTNITYAAFNAAKAVTAGTGLTEPTPGTLAVDSSAVQFRVSGVSDTEIGYLDGVTSAIQTQLDAKAPIASPTFTGTVTVAASGVAFTDGTQTKEGVPSRTEIVYATAAYNLSTGGVSLRDEMIEISHTGGSAIDITVPADSTTNFPIGTSIDLLRTNSGKVRVVGAAGVTVNATPGAFLREQWSGATLFKRAANTWVLMGDLATS